MIFLRAFVLGTALLLATSRPVVATPPSVPAAKPWRTGRLAGLFASGEAVLSAEALADFRWCDTLGLPDPCGLPVVHVATGSYSSGGDGWVEEIYAAGLLLDHDERGNFRVFAPATNRGEDTFVRSYRPARAGAPAWERTGYEEVSLEKTMDTLLTQVATRAVPDHYRIRGNFERCAEQALLFFWAWACWHNGLEERAARLHARAAALLPDARDFQGGASETLRGVLSAEFGRVIGNGLTWDFADPKLSRPQLLARCEATHGGGGWQRVETLRAMIVEDAAHAARVAVPLDTLPVAEQADELVFRLRDQTSHGSFYPTHWQTVAQDPVSPAARLAALGSAAVPALMAALDDRRFTRTVKTYASMKGYLPNRYEVVTVGEYAQGILENMAGQVFQPGWTARGDGSKESESAGFRARAQAWWGRVQAKGMERTMVDDLLASAGNDEEKDGWFVPIGLAQTLTERYPDAAPDGLIQAMHLTRRADLQESLLGCLGRLPTDQGVPFLEKTLRESDERSQRAIAARCLCKHGRGEEAVAAMADEWEHPRTSAVDARLRRGGLLRGGNVTPLKMLAECGRTDAVAVLERGLTAQPVDVRLRVIHALREASWQGRKDEPPVLAAKEWLLGRELEDTDEEWVNPPEADDEDEVVLPLEAMVTSHRVDEAAAALAALLPRKYLFNPGAAPEQRDWQRMVCLEIWRKSRAATE